MVTTEAGNPLRREIEVMIREGDLRGLLFQAGALHGHFCNYLAYGVKGAAAAVRELDVQNTGMEEVVAIVETNNCLSDGVQLVSGCTFGNNALIYKDLGKTAFTLAKRSGEGVRYVLNPDFESSRQAAYPQAYDLWDRLVAQKQAGTPEEFQRMMGLFHQMALQEIEVPLEDLFVVEEHRVPMPPSSVMFSSLRCAKCRENVTENRTRRVGEELLCLSCAEDHVCTVDSRGISVD